MHISMRKRTSKPNPCAHGIFFQPSISLSSCCIVSSAITSLACIFSSRCSKACSIIRYGLQVMSYVPGVGRFLGAIKRSFCRTIPPQTSRSCWLDALALRRFSLRMRAIFLLLNIAGNIRESVVGCRFLRDRCHFTNCSTFRSARCCFLSRSICRRSLAARFFLSNSS